MLCVYFYTLWPVLKELCTRIQILQKSLLSISLYVQKLKEAVQFLNLHVSYISTYTSKIERPEFYLFAFRVRVRDGGGNKLHSAYKVPPASSK